MTVSMGYRASQQAFAIFSPLSTNVSGQLTVRCCHPHLIRKIEMRKMLTKDKESSGFRKKALKAVEANIKLQKSQKEAKLTSQVLPAGNRSTPGEYL